jgi:hypothetical protein
MKAYSGTFELGPAKVEEGSSRDFSGRPGRQAGKDGDRIDLVKVGGTVKVGRLPRAAEILRGLRRVRGSLPAAERLGRDEAHEC